MLEQILDESFQDRRDYVRGESVASDLRKIVRKIGEISVAIVGADVPQVQFWHFNVRELVFGYLQVLRSLLHVRRELFGTTVVLLR